MFLGNFNSQPVTVNATRAFENIPSNASVYVTSVGFQPETAVGYV